VLKLQICVEDDFRMKDDLPNNTRTNGKIQILMGDKGEKYIISGWILEGDGSW
jgi:hypothetical protein